MVVKGIGAGSPIGPVAPVGDVHAAQGAAGVGATASVGSTDPSTLVHGAVRDVAARVRAGEVSRGPDALDAVVDRLARLQVGDRLRGPALEQRIAEMQFALGSDPTFAARVESLLSDALDR